jgi:hypothetical protein
LEFGLGGIKAKPHWRPAIRSLAKEGIRRILKKPEFKKALTVPAYSGWTNWPTGTKVRISDKVAKGYVPFQKRLGINVR